MTNFIQVQWTSESIDEARAITRILVEKKQQFPMKIF